VKAYLDKVIRELEKIDKSRTEDVVINGVTNDSRKVEKGHLFVAIRGETFDGHKYVNMAIERGAVAVVVDRDFNQELPQSVAVLKCENTRIAYSKICSNWFERPSEKLILIGVTGTNGKTSVTSLLYSLFKGMGYKVGLISTVEILIGDERVNAQMTTPDAYVLHDYFSQMSEAGCSYVFMEVSSHALHQYRVRDVDFDVAVFTNISHDHLDYHETFKNYISAKKLLFDNLRSDAVAIVNVDDSNGQVMVQNTRAKVLTYGLRSYADYKSKVLSSGADGMLVSLNDVQFYTRLVGRFNVYNLTAVYGVVEQLLDVDEMEVFESLSAIMPPKGRMELVHQKPYVIVDYAHTPDALDNVLKSVRADYKSKILVVVGCGGDRDKTKRPVMAQIAAVNSDYVVLTSDNPRTEEPQSIIDDMVVGVDLADKHKVLTMTDRAMAIKTAIMLAGKDDVVIIAGKGHETYQEIEGVKHYFSDQETVKNILFKDI
jgi:UDP-N-acetylmuramoyl-L-alanyl-D-glutamate--2,6-diaminopimelate ligase